MVTMPAFSSEPAIELSCALGVASAARIASIASSYSGSTARASPSPDASAQSAIPDALFASMARDDAGDDAGEPDHVKLHWRVLEKFIRVVRE